MPADIEAKKPAELSGGMKKRVGLARALHGIGNRRELDKLVAELLPEVERLGLRGAARDLRALLPSPAPKD